MRGQPGHTNLHGGRFVEAVETAPRYRLFEVDGRWPALLEDDDGVAIAAELYELEEPHIARLTALEPPGWNRAPIELADDHRVDAFLADSELRARGRDVS